MTAVPAPRDCLETLFAAALDAVQPERILARHLPPRPKGRTLVIGAGKASAAMAQAVEAAWNDDDLFGLVVTRYGHGAPCRHIEIVEAAHPVPDTQGQDAAERILGLCQDLENDDLVLCLFSGGGSALLSLPASAITLQDKQAVNAALLASGAPIQDINCVRKHLSAIKGGRLAQAVYPAQAVTLAISDVVGDDPAVIASGPTEGDPTTRLDALDVLKRWNIDAPTRVWNWLSDPQSETPKPGDGVFEYVETHIIAKPQDALDAAALKAKELGLHPLMLGDAVEGEAREAAEEHAALARHELEHAERPVVLLSGGETTVSLIGNGSGGPNGEYALALALALDGQAGVFAIACDTDGSDGSSDAAGAIIDPTTLARAEALSPQTYLDNNDSAGFFAALGDAVVSGPTHTNVNDFRAILIVPNG